MDINDIFKDIAKKHHVSVEEVRCEIQKAIDDAYENPGDDLTAYRQRQIPRKGERPTPEEFIAYCNRILNEEK